MKKHTLGALAALLAALALILAFALPTDAADVAYLTEKARRGDINKTVNAAGEVAAVQLVSVGAQVSGQIERLYVELGDVVKKGDLIAEIDSTTQRNTLEIDKAKLRTYEAQLVSRQTALKTAKAKYERERKLYRQDATSSENLENAQNAMAQAEADVAETTSLISQAKVSVSTDETNLGYTKISAPLDGTVVSVPVEEGQTVNANQTTPTIVQIADLRQMEIRMEISEGDVTKVKPGMAVSFTILSEPDRVFHGRLKSIDPGLTTMSNGNYTGATDADTAVYYYGKALADNAEGLLRIGLTTQNVIQVAEAKDVILVPSITITSRQGRTYVQVMEKRGKSPVEREIKTGVSDNMNTEVLEGLEEGDEVVSTQMAAGEKVGNGGGRAPRAGGMKL